VTVAGSPLRPRHLAALTVLLGATALALTRLSAWPWPVTAPGEARLRVSLRHVSALEAPAAGDSGAPVSRLRHMRPLDPSRPTTGRRAEATLTVSVDGRPVLRRTYRPSGFRHDGPIYAYEELAVTPGRHQVAVSLRDATAAPAVERRWSGLLEIPPDHARLLEHTPDRGWTSE
jgi:hypothetical protein